MKTKVIICGILIGIFLLVLFPVKMAYQDRSQGHLADLQETSSAKKPAEEPADGTVKTSTEIPADKTVATPAEIPAETVAPISAESIVEEIQTAKAGTIFLKKQLEGIGVEHLFYKEEISDALFARILGKSFKEDCTIPRETLVYLRVMHMGFDGESHVGELVVNSEVAEDILAIFQELYKAGYPIEKMVLIDEYGADDEASMADNNTSAFNYRNISHSTRLSNHSYGKAIDINPLYNPYVKVVRGELVCQPANAEAYMDREKEFDHKITAEDLCCRLFKEHGFAWGGDWEESKDYQHFEK